MDSDATVAMIIMLIKVTLARRVAKSTSIHMAVLIFWRSSELISDDNDSKLQEQAPFMTIWPYKLSRSSSSQKQTLPMVISCPGVTITMIITHTEVSLARRVAQSTSIHMAVLSVLAIICDHLCQFRMISNICK